MGVLNVTPDSFSDGGRHLQVADALAHAESMIADGVHCIDVGGESTRPGAEPVPPDEECGRVLPVLEAVAPVAVAAGVRLSIDTRNEATARAAVAAGATLVNDVSASLWPLAAELGVGWVAMHMVGDPRTMQREPHYDDVVADVRRFLVERATVARRAGVEEVWIDPGIGFGKTTEHNLALLAHLDVLVAEGFDVLVGTSRKRFTGQLLAESDQAVHERRHARSPVLHTIEAFPVSAPVPVEDRLDGSLATAVWAMVHGARMVRVHDVRETLHASTVVSGDFGGR